MEIACFAAGALFSAAQFLLAKKVFNITAKAGSSALYVFQLLILSLGLLVVMFYVAKGALLAFAAGLVITSITLAVINNLKE